MISLPILGAGLLIGLFMVPGVVLAFPLTVLTASFGDRQVVLLGLTLTVIGGVFASISETFSLGSPTMRGHTVGLPGCTSIVSTRNNACRQTPCSAARSGMLHSPQNSVPVQN